MADADSRTADETEQFLDGTLIRRAVRSQVILLACAGGLVLAASRVTGLPRRMLVACALTVGAGHGLVGISHSRSRPGSARRSADHASRWPRALRLADAQVAAHPALWDRTGLSDRRG